MYIKINCINKKFLNKMKEKEPKKLILIKYIVCIIVRGITVTKMIGEDPTLKCTPYT